jgi:hypothetical protein
MRFDDTNPAKEKEDFEKVSKIDWQLHYHCQFISIVASVYYQWSNCNVSMLYLYYLISLYI